MAKFGEIPCLYYECKGYCKKNRSAEYKGYCQKCDKYISRARIHPINKKKQELQKLRIKDYV